jgi:NodT family efflux transporter outer membrane factor (OMF) lipoprotein
MKKILLLLPVALIGCGSVGPNYVPSKPNLPSAFSTSGGTVTLPSRWWESFKDPELNNLILKALTQSPDAKLAEARLRQARAVQGIQDAADGPKLGVGGFVNRDKLSSNSEMMANVPTVSIGPQGKPVSNTPQTNFTNRQIAFDASWELDFFGHNRRLSEAANARTEAARERLRDAGLILSAEVGRNYVQYRMLQQRMGLATENLKNLEDLVHLTAVRSKAGEVSRQDVQRAEINRQNYEASLTELRFGMRQSLIVLSTLTDQPLAALEEELGKPAALMTIPDVPVVGVPSDLLQRRPDVRNSERELAAASADIGVAVADRYPRFSLVGSGGWNSVKPESLLNNVNRMWSIGPRVYLPLFDRGRIRSQVKANEAAYDAASASYRKTVLMAFADVEVALSRIAFSEERRSLLSGAESQQSELFHTTESQWKAGEVSKVALLEARRSLIAQQDQVLQAKADSLSAMVSLCKALGGGWTSE